MKKIVALLLGIVLITTGCQSIRSLQLVNEARTQANVPLVLHSPELSEKAQRWAEFIASDGRLIHSNLAQYSSMGWRVVGENLAVASDVEAAHVNLFNSYSHRKTMLNPAYTHLGVGVVERPAGKFWIVQVYAG